MRDQPAPCPDGAEEHTEALAAASNKAALGASPDGIAAGLVLEQHPACCELVADAIRFGPVLRAARRGARRDACVDLCIGQARLRRAPAGGGRRAAREGE